MTATKEYSKRFDDHTAYFLDEACTILHRDNDLPAIVCDDGDQVWYNYGKRHRETGPSVLYLDGEKLYYLNGIQYSEEEFYKLIDKPSFVLTDEDKAAIAHVRGLLDKLLTIG